MNGQWIGDHGGSNRGTLVLDLDDVHESYSGRVYVFDGEAKLPDIMAMVEIPKLNEKFETNLALYPIDPRTGLWVDWPSVQNLYPDDVVFPKTAETVFSRQGDELKVSWKTAVSHGESLAVRSIADQPSRYTGESAVTSWEDFKNYVGKLDDRRYVFRGQRHNHRLRTGFHRSGRADLGRFINQDVTELHRSLSGRVRHPFDLGRPEHNAAFYSLLQHHGYPTPLLDWTYSPYVAAYFAFRGNCACGQDETEDRVRIYLFDQKQWQQENLHRNWLIGCRPHVSLIQAHALNNERLVPQQSLSMLSNIDDIETLISTKQQIQRQQYLRVIEMPINQRDLAMRELRLMGVTAGSLFPGIDGTCEEMRERMFPKL